MFDWSHLLISTWDPTKVRQAFYMCVIQAVTDKIHPSPLISIWSKQTTGLKLGIENVH